MYFLFKRRLIAYNKKTHEIACRIFCVIIIQDNKEKQAATQIDLYFFSMLINTNTSNHM
ncbi:hypothetical protein MS6016_50440 [Klebsiella variicola]|nr:hypothetical protein NUKP86_50350 [Klebsiella variicola]GKO70288.1 hypothetical protein MS6016_50440 [Klebsiella variicola]